MSTLQEATQPLVASREALYHLNSGVPVPPELAYAACREALEIDDPGRRHYFLGSLLHGMLVAGPDVNQVRSLLDAAFSIDDYQPQSRQYLGGELPSVTVIGSGKKGVKTVNLSSLAAITASSSGEVAVCKTVSGATSSLTGSADFASHLGIHNTTNTERSREITLRTGLGIFSVASCIPEFVRRYDGIFYAPHAMSFGLAGLLAPYKTDGLLYGLAHQNTDLSASVLSDYGAENPLVVSTNVDGIRFVDEALPTGTTSISSLRLGRTLHQRYRFGDTLPPVDATSYLQVATQDSAANVEKGLRALLPKSESDLRHTVALNAGLILCAAGVQPNPNEGYAASLEYIDSGTTARHLQHFVDIAADGPHQLDELFA